MIGNNVSHNVGGILLSDGGFGISVGPAAHNLIAFNQFLGQCIRLRDHPAGP